MSERIGIVGVGRMGANMARRLNDQHFTITAISDVNAEAAKSLANELGSTYYEKLSHVTKNADVIITVVIDDKARKHLPQHRPLWPGPRKAFHWTAPPFRRPHTSRSKNGPVNMKPKPSKPAWPAHYTGSRRYTLPNVRRQTGSLRPRQADP